MTRHRLYLFDTTLRDGAQTPGVDFSVEDKIAIAAMLDDFGFDYVEGGYPGANPTDTAFFADPPALDRAKLVAFGMTRRAGMSASNDPGLSAVLNADTAAVCLVGKSWDFHVDVALNVPREENLASIRESIAAAVEREAQRAALRKGEEPPETDEDKPLPRVAPGTAAFLPSAEWLRRVKAELPLSTIMRLLHHLAPQIEELIARADYSLDEEAILGFIRSTTMVGLLPVPHAIVVRKYQPNTFTSLWFTAFLWGVVFLQNQAPPLFDGPAIKLFTVSVV